MRIDEIVRVQNPLGGDFKSQLDRDEAAKAVRANRKANREIPGRVAAAPVSPKSGTDPRKDAKPRPHPRRGAMSGTDPQSGMFTPGAVQTKSYNNAFTKQFARPAGQGKGLDIMGRKIKAPVQQEPVQQEPVQQEPVQQEPTQTTAPVINTPAKPWWATGQNVNIPAVQRKQQAAAQQPQAAQPAQPTSNTVTPQGFNATNVMKMPGMEKYAKPAVAKPANFAAGPTGYGKTTTAIKGAPTAAAPAPVAKTQAAPAQPVAAPAKQAMPMGSVKIGGQKLNPNNPEDARMIQMIQAQLPKMQTPAVVAVKNAADKTLATRKATTASKPAKV
jgi:hypothetical protein